MRLARRRRLLAAALLGVAIATSCGVTSARPAGVLLITLDTTRADHLGCYGFAQAATPNLDALAKESVRFEEAMSAVPNTLPSHSTMFTGLYPPRHGVRYNGMFRLGEGSVTIAKRMHDAGFFTGAIPAAFPVYAKSGLNQGFDVYRDMFSEPGAERLQPDAERSAADVVKLGLETIRGAGGKPFFVWLHFYEPHYPYKPPFPYASQFREHPYDGEIAYVDRQLGELFAALKKDGLWDRIAIVVAGDHGEGLYEHGERMHSQLAYQSTLRVPLLVKSRVGKGGTVVREPVSLADVGPTVLDLAGLPVPAGLDGISLREALATGKAPLRPLYFETLAGSLAFCWSPIEGVRRGKWKLIRANGVELYDLEADPSEKNDLATVDASVASDLAAGLDANLATWAAAGPPASATEAPIDAEALSRLASLGYVGGSVNSSRRGGPNPKDLVRLESELLLVQDLMGKRQYTAVMQAVPGLLAADPGNRLVLHDAADASAGLRDFPAAEAYARETISRYPEYVPAVVTLGRVLVAQKRYKDAEAVFREGLTHSADEPILLYSLAMSLIAEGRVPDAEPVVAKALAAKSPEPAFHVLQALCRVKAGDPAAAKTALTQAIAGGYAQATTLRTEPLFAPLRGIPGFEEIISPKKGT
jgi:arylsulfatase A-like enzyme